MKKEQRIRTRQSFQTLFKKGKAARGRSLNIWIRDEALQKERESKRPKIGIVVSRKVSPKATTRNLWKRRIREVFRTLQDQIKPGLSVLIQARPGAQPPELKEIEEELKTLLVRSEGWK